jgi:hypothetical protein
MMQATKQTKTEKIIVRSILQMGLRINGNNMLQRSYYTIWACCTFVRLPMLRM